MAVLRGSNTASEGGFALIVVMWMLTLLIIMASSFSLTLRRETAVLTDVKALAQARALAEGGVNVAMLNLLPNDETLRWRSDGSLYEIIIAGAPVRIRIEDQSGKIDINFADVIALKSLFDSAGVEEALRERLIAAILDWRDPDEIQSPQGAEKEQYQKAGLNYVPANKGFEALEELQLVLGMTPALYQQLEPLLTIYSNSATVNPAKAPREVLLTLPNATPELVDSYLKQRVENARSGLPEVAPTWAAASPNVSRVYEIIAEAMPIEGITGAFSAVVRSGGGSRLGIPFSILKWHKRSLEQTFFADAEDTQLIQ